VFSHSLVVGAVLLASILLQLGRAQIPSRFAKQQMVRDYLKTTKYTNLPNYEGRDITTPANLIAFSVMNMDLSFSAVSDVIPAGHTKFIHALGSTALAKYVSTGDHSFTGLFEGADSCLVRLSLAADPKKVPYTPGMAFKCYRDGNAPSGNLFSMFSLDGQGTNTNFFANLFSNIVPEPQSGPLQVLGKVVFGRASSCPAGVSTANFARVEQTGNPVSKPSWPIKLFLRPTPEITSYGKTASEDIRLQAAGIASGTKLWDVEHHSRTRVQKIGEIWTTSEFFASSYQDDTLFFQHEKGEVDGCATM